MKANDQSKRSEKISIQCHHFGAVFAEEDRETGRVVPRPCLSTRQSHSVQLDSRRVCDFVARQSRKCDVGGLLTAAVGLQRPGKNAPEKF